MSLLSLFSRRGTAAVAKDRLQILLSHERTTIGRPDLVAILRDEIIAVITKHIAVDRDKVKVQMERGEAMSTLEVEVEIPTPEPMKLAG